MIESDKRIIGCAALKKASEAMGYLERLAVVPGMRNRGVGLRLVNHIISEAKSLGFEKISIGIIAKQHELKEWYQKIGFIETGRKSFSHLPFEVCFMEYPIKARENS